MGYDERHQSSSSGAAVAIVVAVLLVAALGIVIVGSAALFWVRTSQVEAMVTHERTVAELRRIGVEAHRADVEAQREVEEAQVEATPDPRLNFEVKIDREGNTSVDGKSIDVDELRATLTELKEESGNAYLVKIYADSECPVQQVVAVLDVLEELGGVEFHVESPEPAELSSNDAN
jgi:biopolymer transport protein ExbD